MNTVDGTAGNDGVVWARKVVARGWPSKNAPMAERVEWYEELASAYQTLAGQASDAGDVDTYLARSELAEHADRLARDLRGPDQPW